MNSIREQLRVRTGNVRTRPKVPDMGSPILKETTGGKLRVFRL